MRRLTTIVFTVALATVAVTSVADAQDRRSPDSRDSARQVAAILSGQSATGRGFSAGRTEAQDLRSVDARDSGRHGSLAPPRSSLTASPATTQTTVAQATPQGFSWGDAGIGAAAMLAVVAIAMGAILIVGHRRRDERFPVATR
jgi:hypothetical protein